MVAVANNQPGFPDRITGTAPVLQAFAFNAKEFHALRSLFHFSDVMPDRFGVKSLHNSVSDLSTFFLLSFRAFSEIKMCLKNFSDYFQTRLNDSAVPVFICPSADGGIDIFTFFVCYMFCRIDARKAHHLADGFLEFV